jgi:hypothetical protein
MTTKTNFRVRTPHAAVKIWNYVDRMSADGANFTPANEVREEIVSTVSCSAIQTIKAKADPVGKFNLVLAPTRNWTAVITPGSWCVIMMSNEPITREDFKKANPRLVKMVGKIETVRTQVVTNQDGSRSTNFLVSGQDWGHVLNSTLYIDPLIMDQKENNYDQGTSLFAALVQATLKDGTPTPSPIKNNLAALLNLFGLSLVNIEGKITRLGKNTHSPLMPRQMSEFFGFSTSEIMKTIELVSGALQSDGAYSDVPDGLGWINPYSLAGSHNLWQVLQDNGNYALNEMFSDIVWEDGSARLALFNRIRPFAFRESALSSESVELRSHFKYVPAHHLDDVSIMSVNAGTNWRDKYNFLEIKPEIAEFNILENWTKQKSQIWDRESNDVFDREGFRPLIFTTKQLPYLDINGTQQPDIDSLTKWTSLLQEWYFDTHRLLNGQIVMTGSSEYITVGNNIMFDAGILGVKPNLNSGMLDVSKRYYILAHVETVKHAFQVDDSGSRSFQTTLDFVRGIIVDAQKNLVGEGVLDTLSISMPAAASMNDVTVIADKE